MTQSLTDLELDLRPDEDVAPSPRERLRAARARAARALRELRDELRQVRHDATAPRPEHSPHRVVGWRRALAIGCGAFALWLVADAPTLQHNAQGSPLGARRTVALDVLGPVAALSRGVGLSHLVGAADRVMGRTGHGVVQAGPPLHQSGPPAMLAAGAGPKPTTAAPLPTPTPAAPLRVLAIGDSLGVDFGGPFVDDLAATGVVGIIDDARIDTGLARPDYFDWPQELQADLQRYHPQVVVVFLGANDPQNMVDGGGALAYGTPAWFAAYGRRVGGLMQQATQAGARVLWVGMPPMADPGLDAKMRALDSVYAAQTLLHPGVTYLSSWPVLADGSGNYAEFLPDASGSEVAVREPDGTHVSWPGAERLSQAVIGAMDRIWGLTLKP
ncbi:MAG TPA: DUF459 domain-containing protein [Acidimicrobiales bacterium]|nr:DUF459 domain-containing protein [Acidimicrobiales bacterium]